MKSFINYLDTLTYISHDWRHAPSRTATSPTAIATVLAFQDYEAGFWWSTIPKGKET